MMLTHFTIVNLGKEKTEELETRSIPNSNIYSTEKSILARRIKEKLRLLEE